MWNLLLKIPSILSLSRKEYIHTSIHIRIWGTLISDWFFNHFCLRETNAYRDLTDLRVRCSMLTARIVGALNDSHNQVLYILAPNSAMNKENLHHFRAHYPQWCVTFRNTHQTFLLCPKTTEKNDLYQTKFSKYMIFNCFFILPELIKFWSIQAIASRSNT